MAKFMKIPPAQLWIGDQYNTTKQIKQYLQKLFCKDSGCQKCSLCNQIENKQHHCAIWLKTEKYYTLDQIEIIFKTISFQLDQGQKLFFIIQNADFLTSACSNSLLKSVEEPPEGYHFIFLAERLSKILPTIQSRCIIKTFYSADKKDNQNQLIQTFTSSQLCPPARFLKILDEEKPNEKETIEILDQLLDYWIKGVTSSIEKKDKTKYKLTTEKARKIKKAMLQTPMPGSSKIFWRNFYLQFI